MYTITFNNLKKYLESRKEISKSLTYLFDSGKEEDKEMLVRYSTEYRITLELLRILNDKEMFNTALEIELGPNHK